MVCLLTATLLFAGPVKVPEHFECPFAAQDATSAAQWQKEVRGRLLGIVAACNPRGDAPLDVKIGEFEDGEEYREAKLTFVGNEGTPLVATLTVPRERVGAESFRTNRAPFPAMVCLHGHGGSREKIHDSGSEYKGLAAEFARRGFVTLAPSLDHREYAPNQLWNLMRLVDVLETLPEVDKMRIGAAGLSMGGEWTMWLAACDVRIKAAVVSGWMCTTEGVLRVPNCPCWMPPGLLDLCDIAEVHILIAPRSLLIESATEDGCFPIDAVRTGFEKIKHGYAVFGAENKVRHHTFPGGHAWNGGEAYDFVENVLR